MFVCVLHFSVLPTYLWFIQQTDDDAKGPEVSNHILWVVLHILLFEDVNQSLKSQKQTDERQTYISTQFKHWIFFRALDRGYVCIV